MLVISIAARGLVSEMFRFSRGTYKRLAADELDVRAEDNERVGGGVCSDTSSLVLLLSVLVVDPRVKVCNADDGRLPVV